MRVNKFIQPLIDFPKSTIIDKVENKTYTYQEFYDAILCVENEINALDIKENTIVVIYGYRNSFNSLILFFYCIKNNLTPFIVEQGNLNYVDGLNFNVLLTPDTLKFEKYGNTTVSSFKYGNVYQNFHKELYVGSSNDFTIVSSSGSTSKITKKILLGKKETLNNILSNQKALSINENDKTLIILPISYSYGLIAQFFSHLLIGANIILADKTLGILQLPSIIKEYTITNIFMTPLMSRLLLYYNQKLSTIKNNLNFITIGGDKPNKLGVEKLQKVFQCPIYSTYGLAEAGPRVATKQINLNETLDLSIGTANPEIKMEVINVEKYQTLCNSENAGYLNIKTPSIYLGYIKGKKLQKPESGNVLKTKDVCIKKGNEIYLLGRDEEYIIQKNKIIWFYEIGSNFYENPNVLKVKIKKEKQNKLDIKVYHRNRITTSDFTKTLATKYALTKNLEYSIQLVEFKNSQYK